MKTKAFFMTITVLMLYSFSLTLLTGCTSSPTYKLTPQEEARADSLARQELKRDSIVKAQKDSIDNVNEVKEQKAFEKTKAGRIWKKHPEWDKDDCEELAKGNIWIGMDIKMVVYLRGNPNSKNVSNYGSGNEYQYCWWNYATSCFYCGENGTVTSYN